MHRFAACLWSAGALLAQTNPTEVPPIQSVWSLTPPLPLPPSTVTLLPGIAG